MCHVKLGVSVRIKSAECAPLVRFADLSAKNCPDAKVAAEAVAIFHFYRTNFAGILLSRAQRQYPDNKSGKHNA